MHSWWIRMLVVLAWCAGLTLRAQLPPPAVLHKLDIPGLPAETVYDLDFDKDLRIRYTTDDQLRQGLGFAIVELNDTLSESTNLYDPKRSIFWAYGVLFSQWRTLYELGQWRRNQGSPGVTAVQLIRMARDHFKHRDGPAIAD